MYSILMCYGLLASMHWVHCTHTIFNKMHQIRVVCWSTLNDRLFVNSVVSDKGFTTTLFYWDDTVNTKIKTCSVSSWWMLNVWNFNGKLAKGSRGNLSHFLGFTMFQPLYPTSTLLSPQRPVSPQFCHGFCSKPRLSGLYSSSSLLRWGTTMHYVAIPFKKLH